jgi:predicted TIM-barrel fold metal-dependent hydrolase
MLFDAQLLCGSDHWLAANKQALAHRLTPGEASLALSEAAGGELWRAALFPFPSAPGQVYDAENRLVIEAARRDSRFLAIGAVNPHVPENMAALEVAAERGLIGGLAIWPILCDLDLRTLAGERRLWQLAENYDLPVTVHVGTGAESDYRPAVVRNNYAPVDAVALARSVPQVRFNLSHCLRLSRAALDMAAHLDNVWTDTSGLSAIGRWREVGQQIFLAADGIIGVDESPNFVVSRLIEDFGFAFRIMFASSHPFSAWWGFSLKDEVEACLHLPLPPSMSRDLMYRNACNFFGITPDDND